MNWLNVEQIVAYFEIDSSPDDIQAIKKALKKRMSKLHPDNNSQRPQTEDQKDDWQELVSAKEFMDNKSDNQLISLSQLPALIKSLNAAALTPIDTRITNLKNDAHQSFHRSNALPRIGSGVFAAITGFLFTFSGAIKDHPLLGEWLSTSTSQMVLLGLMFYSGVFFIYTWIREKRQEEKVAWLTSNEGIKRTLAQVLKRERNDDQSNNNRITPTNLISEITGREFSRHTESVAIILSRARLPLSIAEKIALIQIDSLLERGVLVELPAKGFEKTYEVTRQAIDELLRR
jgi:hypothetical protein